jgi:NDP-sugar pyrophosphorylase family protein
MLSPQDLFDLSQFPHASIFDGCGFAWDALPRIEDYIMRWFSTVLPPQICGNISAGVAIEGPVYIGKHTYLEPGVLVRGPAILGENCQIRQGAYIRGNLLLGNNCIVGHATEVKNSIFLNQAHASHFAYVGDSILGNRVNLGAGTKLANLSVFSVRDPASGKRPSLRLRLGDAEIDTGLSKLGAILGDDVQTGCNTITNPGCIVGPRTLIYALVSLRKGCYPADSIIRLHQQTEEVRKT